MAYDTNLQHLHPTMRAKVKTLIKSLALANVPIQIHEGYRTAARQHEKFNQGHPDSVWRSFYQYGVACAFAVVTDGAVRRDASDVIAGYWKKFRELAIVAGLESPGMDQANVQLPGLSISQLIKGQYPEGGDESWRKNLNANITASTHTPKPPIASLTGAIDNGFASDSERDDKATEQVERPNR